MRCAAARAAARLAPRRAGGRMQLQASCAATSRAVARMGILQTTPRSPSRIGVGGLCPPCAPQWVTNSHRGAIMPPPRAARQHTHQTTCAHRQHTLAHPASQCGRARPGRRRGTQQVPPQGHPAGASPGAPSRCLPLRSDGSAQATASCWYSWCPLRSGPTQLRACRAPSSRASSSRASSCRAWRPAGRGGQHAGHGRW